MAYRFEDLFTEKVDDEGQAYYSLVVDGETYNLDYGYANNLIDSLNGHLAPSDLSERIMEIDNS